MVKLRKDKAERDEWCKRCSYPFDQGDAVFVSNNGDIYCSKYCAQYDVDVASVEHYEQLIPSERHDYRKGCASILSEATLDELDRIDLERKAHCLS